ncbi:PLP-dependent transferase [Trichoderma citrinoviride]|uniref:PLP-dependent transferase n=1 Tax=Trichoderma citrinoviride TaxID=58853 RepID=A0A2T4B1P2_9HYPO|nr:PLP-dependent transferase [Trichoderma citrinoviride]PTB63121.1 PLP-dependent transferase [Trichoderma citrinoviride]
MPQPPPPLAAPLWRSLRTYQIFGANTEVGKTVFSTLLAKAAARRSAPGGVAFLKPVSTGPDSEADDRCIHITKFAPDVSNKTLFQYKIPVSPHIAARLSNATIPSNEALLFQTRDYAAQCANIGRKWLFVETAGGVHSPGPSGTTQADMYAPLRLPVVLVGDSRLGGISSTISAFESLRMRGYDVESVVLFKEDRYQNYEYLLEYFAEHHDVPVAGVVEPPGRKSSLEEDVGAMAQYYEEQSQHKDTSGVISHLDDRHERRIARLNSMAADALQNIWYPFTQQSLLSPKDINVIDSAHGDHFQTLSPCSTTSQPDSLLRASFDGSASWWTQGLGHANPKLTLAAAYAAGRYGHVMFASGIHRPAAELSTTLLKGMDNPRLSRVFFSDNGSTGIEVALKMGLRAAKLRYGWAAEEKLGVVGLRGSYHGDTIGAMDCSEPSGYNEKVEWYDGKGHWFDYPTVLCVDGKWRVNVPQELREALGEDADFGSLSDIFDVQGREQKGHHLRYEAFIRETLERLQKQGRRFGSVIIEPVVLGAGGMALVDPLFQRALVNVVRKSPDLFRKPNASFESPSSPTAWTGLPIIFDEVFTGLYRLGRFSSSSFLETHADVSVHAKLLTGGLVPLCTTLASENIFEAFSSQDKTDALLHGHSYTAHPVGCQVALESLKEMQKMDRGGSWSWAKSQGWTTPGTPVVGEQPAADVWSTWPRDLVEDLSRQTERVSGIWALGSVLAIHLKDASGTGYFSDAAQSVRDGLIAGDREGVNGPWNVHCRVLGNVLYLMAGQKTTEESIARIGSLLRERLKE